MAKALDTLTITPAREGYLIQIDDEEGDTFEFTASFEQLDLISEEIDRQLNADEEDALGADDEEDAPGEE
ncbi:hypothetical protein [uncultured Sphingomonas sp.]|uniref:hypothetical protein n=1 Tax=uncultured Sphingomonas sp. TaxID=158754 RepID=UPI0035C9F603